MRPHIELATIAIGLAAHGLANRVAVGFIPTAGLRMRFNVTQSLSSTATVRDVSVYVPGLARIGNIVVRNRPASAGRRRDGGHHGRAAVPSNTRRITQLTP